MVGQKRVTDALKSLHSLLALPLLSSRVCGLSRVFLPLAWKAVSHCLDLKADQVGQVLALPEPLLVLKPDRLMLLQKLRRIALPVVLGCRWLHLRGVELSVCHLSLNAVVEHGVVLSRFTGWGQGVLF
jgi:hypothetical protein